ncbi:MAG TPA: histidine kinase [Gemmatimonadaceae bacterium]|jgi:hypothetical protein
MIAPRSRTPIWLQLLLGWLPVGVLLTLLVLTAHQTTPHAAMFIAARGVIAGVIVCLPLYRLTKRWPWPERVTVGFVLRQAVAAVIFSVAFVFMNSAIESVVRRHLVITVGVGLVPFLVFGVYLYVMVAGVIYASDATARAARAEAMAAKSQLAALRSQLNPHFLFNALHAVVQLIPRDPALASSAAEEVAALLRTTLEEDRDLVPLADELVFVRRYLSVERIRFGDRLIVEESIAAPALNAFVPVFAVQTLIENAVRHGATPRIEPTTVWLSAGAERNALTVGVRDNGAGALSDDLGATTGSGLARLRERLAALFGDRARLDVAPGASGGFTASFTIPLNEAE